MAGTSKGREAKDERKGMEREWKGERRGGRVREKRMEGTVKTEKCES